MKDNVQMVMHEAGSAAGEVWKREKNTRKDTTESVGNEIRKTRTYMDRR